MKPQMDAVTINESNTALSSGHLISDAPHSYNMLREKYAELSNHYEHLKMAYKVLEKKNDAEERHYNAEMEKLREAKNVAIANFQSYTAESEQRIKQIKEQLDEQYRNNFDLLTFEMEKFKLENEQLEEQRIQLQRQIVEQNAELRKIKRENEEREIQIRDTYEEQISKLTDNLLIVHRKNVEDGNNQTEIDILRERYRSLNERYHQLHKESERRQFENDNKIQRLETEILERTLRATRSAIHLQQLSMDVEHYRKSVEFANAERERLKSEIKRLQKEKLISDGESMARENSLTDQLFTQSLLIDKKLNQIDETIAQKDQLIEDLRSKLNNAEIQLKHGNESITNALKSKEELLIELNSLKSEFHKKEDETHLSIEKLKWERDRALQHLADLRKSNGSSDTNTVDEVKKLETAIRNRDVEIRKVKEHYRRLLTKMKRSLLRAEKQIALLNGKFDNNDTKAMDEIMQRYMAYYLDDSDS